MMTHERPGLSRQEALHRVLDALAGVKPRRREAAIATLGLRLERRDERFLLALVRVWEEAPNAQHAPTVHGGSGNWC
jgi:hypothetical protein